jgi:hypothetical protein
VACRNYCSKQGWFRRPRIGNPVTVRILIDEDAGRYRWRLVRRTPQGADVLARGVRAYPDEHACRYAAAALGRAGAEAMLTVQEADGHWRWVVVGPDGEPLAESPAVLRNAAACERALAELRRELARAGLAEPPHAEPPHAEPPHAVPDQAVQPVR